jgi:hypothetical protein
MNNNEKHTEQGPLCFGFVPQVSLPHAILKAVFSIKGLLSLSVIGLGVALYITDLKLDTAIANNEKYQVQISSLEEKLTEANSQIELCFNNYTNLKDSIENAAKKSEKFNLEILDLQNKVDRFNKINSRTIDLFSEQNLAKNCSEAIEELLGDFK